MYINLYPHKQLDKTKSFFSKSGFFLIAGGSYSLFNEVWFRDETRLPMSVAAASLVVGGVVGLCVGLDKIRLKDAFFSMNPEQIRFRLTVYGREQSLLWNEVASVSISTYQVVFLMKNGKQVKMRTGAIQAEEVAHHVQTSIRLAAMEKRIAVNGVSMGQLTTSGAS
ncbi:hypothetical protein FVR03_02170 [Pontibacter qinzhouensis]|uniref:Uncharacterized protein n=1 Tax=Pontibacter qinzhouensis TaxID=2603253 RepID=A0A5C8KDU3_9BACT|nr:hypothetical protein [Pontibacter qinzhouensis]TXK52091.1 hypothetical protein FVR03_02170 [Pontibacter qinzhouensis]